MDQQFKRDKLNCRDHPNLTATYIYYSEEELDLIPVCQACTKTKRIQHEQLLLLKECLSNQDDQIITNWPPLNDEDLEVQYSIALLQQDDYEEILEKRTNYFSKLKESIISVINRIEKIGVQYEQQNLMSLYNQISQKKKLQRVIKDEINNKQKVQEFINSMLKNQEQMQQDVIKELKKQKQMRTLSETQYCDNFFSLILKQLDGFEKMKNIHFDNEDIEEKQVLNIEKMKKEQVKDIILFYDQIQKQYLNDLNYLEKQRDNQTSEFHNEILDILDKQMESIQLNFNQSQSQIQTIITDKIDLVLAVHVSLDDIDKYYIDYQINKNNLQKPFKFQINDTEDWIGVGIVNLEDKPEKKAFFEENIADDINFYYYLISSNGCAWNQEGKNDALNEIIDENGNVCEYDEGSDIFTFGKSEIIQIKVFKEMIEFKNLTKDQTYNMKFQFNENKKYYLCYIIDDQDSIDLQI